MASHSLKALVQQVAMLAKDVAALGALGDLARLVHADAQGNVSITVPPGGSFAIRQGSALRIAVDNRGNVALFGVEAGLFREGGGQANVNAGGLHLSAPGGKASLWLQSDGTILVVGDCQIDADSLAPTPSTDAFSVATGEGSP